MDGMMDHGKDHGGMDMGDMNMKTPPPTSSSSSSTRAMSHKMMMHMSFYWGHDAVILFSGWPGSSTGMYVLSLFVVFVLAVIVEWLSRSRFVKSEADDVVSRFIRTLLHGLRMGMAYLVMLAVMSFNIGVFIVVVLGHVVGFLLFESRVFGSGLKGANGSYVKSSDLPPLSC